jgi:hypothetical protein
MTLPVIAAGINRNFRSVFRASAVDDEDDLELLRPMFTI